MHGRFLSDVFFTDSVPQKKGRNMNNLGITFRIAQQNNCCDPSVEPPRQDDFNEVYP